MPEKAKRNRMPVLHRRSPGIPIFPHLVRMVLGDPQIPKPLRESTAGATLVYFALRQAQNRVLSSTDPAVREVFDCMYEYARLEYGEWYDYILHLVRKELLKTYSEPAPPIPTMLRRPLSREMLMMTGAKQEVNNGKLIPSDLETAINHAKSEDPDRYKFWVEYAERALAPGPCTET